jgi:EmrB/QacA subfamily drug resistance transporter
MAEIASGPPPAATGEREPAPAQRGRDEEELPRLGGHRGVRSSTLTLLLACLAQFMVILDVSVVNVALPSIRHGLGFSEQDLQWVVNAYTVTFAGFLLLGGRAADLLGRRRVFVWGLVLFALASLAGGLAQSQWQLIAARGIQGLGGAVIAPASLSILTTTFKEGAARNRAVGIWGAMGGAGGAAGVLLGGILTAALGWRWILFINVPIGLLASAGAYRFISESRRQVPRRNFDLSGALTATVGLSLLVLGIVRTDVTGWGAATTIGLIGAGLALLAAFVMIEGLLATAPLMPLRIYRSRTLSASNLVVFLIGGATFGMWFFLSLYLQQVLGYSPIKAGLAFLPMTLCIVAGSAVASRAVTRIGVKRMLVGGMVLQSAGLIWFTDITPTGSYWSALLVPSLMVALGIGFAFVPATISAVAGVAPQEAGLASGLVNTSRLFGGALGLAILAALAASRTGGELHGAATITAIHAALTSGFRLAFVVAAVFAAVGGVIALIGLPNLRPLAPAPRPRPAPECAV